MLGLVSAIRALTAVLSDILTQITAIATSQGNIATSQGSIATNTGTIATNTTPADSTDDTEPANDAEPNG